MKTYVDMSHVRGIVTECHHINPILTCRAVRCRSTEVGISSPQILNDKYITDEQPAARHLAQAADPA